MLRPTLLVFALFAAVALGGCGLGDPYANDRPAAHESPGVTPGPPRVGGVLVARADAVAPAAVDPALRFARAYAAYQYGRLFARDLPATLPALRANLATLTPRVPRGVRSRRLRLRELRLSLIAAGAVDAIALVDDGHGGSVLSFVLDRGRRGWVVVSADGAAPDGDDQ